MTGLRFPAVPALAASAGACLRRLYARPRVLELQCQYCQAWVKPRHFRTPAMCCRDCDAAGAVQTWPGWKRGGHG